MDQSVFTTITGCALGTPRFDVGKHLHGQLSVSMLGAHFTSRIIDACVLKS